MIKHGSGAFPQKHAKEESTTEIGKKNKTTLKLNHDLNATTAPVLDPEAPHEVLKIATWNTQSFSREKMAAIHERLIKCYDIALLQEVHNPTTRTQKIFNFNVNEDIYISPGTNHKAGVAIFINTTNPNIKVIPNSLRIDMEGRIIAIQISWFNHTYNLVSIYAPVSDDKSRSEHFEDLMKGGYILPGTNNIIGGDFNVCLNPSKDLQDYSNTVDYTKAHKDSMRTLTGLLEHANVRDSWEAYNLTFLENKPVFTWKQGGPFSTSTTQSRLDRIYISDLIARNVIHATVQETVVSDHMIYEIHIMTPEEHRRYLTGWKFNNQLLKEKKFERKINTIMTRIQEETLRCDKPVGILDKQGEILTAIKRVAKRVGKARAKKMHKHKKNLEMRRVKVQYRLQELGLRGVPSREEIEQLTMEFDRINTELLCMFEQHAEAAKVKTHTDIQLHHELPSSIFLRLQNSRRRKMRIEEVLLEDGRTSRNQEDIVETHLAFQSNLYSQKPIKKEAKQVLLDTIKTSVTEEDILLYNQPFIKEEIVRAIKSLGKNKAVGTDGLSAELYQHYVDQMADVYALIFEACYETRDLPQTTREALICLLFKKGDTKLPKNWRPISLLNTDYKILAKLLAARLSKLLPYLLSRDQNGFVAGRQLEDAVMMCQMVIDYLAINHDSAYLIMLDQEKAFDRVDPTYLLDILRAYKIPEYLINWVSIIYSVVPTKLCINGQVTESILLKSGVRQGCPLSPLLFVLSIEPLANLIREHPEYRGIPLPNNATIKVAMFADDTCFYAKDERSIQIIKEMTEIYANGSGGKANLDKTEILPIGEIGGKTHQESIADIKVLDPSNPVRLLGIMVGNNVNPREVWTPILGKIDKLLNETWRDRYISYRGKLVVIRHLALPIIMFTAPFIHMPKDMSDKLDKTLRKFIFSGKRCKVALDTLKLPIEYGGMNVPNIQCLIDAARIRWIKKLVDDQTPVIWRELGVHMLNIACDSIMGTSILRQSERKTTFTRNPRHRHWLSVLRAWRRLEGKGSISPKTLDEIKSIHLTEIDAKIGKQLAKHNYNTIKDLLSPETSIIEPRYLTREQLVKRPRHNLVSAKTYQELIDKLPKETTTPTHVMDPKDPETIYKVIEETYTRPRRSKRLRNNKGRTHVPHDPKPRLKVQRLKVLEDHFVITSDEPNITHIHLDSHNQVDIHEGKLLGKTMDRGNATLDKLQLKLDGKLEPLGKYTRMKAYHTLQRSNITTHKHHRKWDTHFPGETIYWPTLSTHPTNNPNLINVRFLLMHGAIRIGSQARHWLKNTDLSCPSCKQDCDDIHLFLNCPTTKQAWKHVERLWESLQQKYPTLQQHQIKETYKLFGPPLITARNTQETHTLTFLDIVLGHMQTLIWNGYVNKVFRNIDYTATSIIEAFKTNIKKSLNCFILAMKQKAYVPRRWTNPPHPPGETEHQEDEEQRRIEIITLLRNAILKETRKKIKRRTQTPTPDTKVR